MAHQIRTLLALDLMNDLERRCALLDLLTEEEQEYEKLHHNFRLLDDVFVDFMSTNHHRGRCWSLEQLLGIRTSHPGKGFGYVSSGVPYESTVWCFEGEGSAVLAVCCPRMHERPCALQVSLPTW